MSLQNTIISTEDAADTEAFGVRLGSQLRGGEVIELIGDLGSGKTTLVRGIAKGLESPDHVSSPTFTVYKVYNGGKLPIYHYDFYRLQDDVVIKNELAEIVAHKQAVIVLEWAEQIGSALPKEHIKITFRTLGEDIRELSVVIPPKCRYIEL
jgi:tRNA threonylcarbamoyladenosine biosynthesis protein TsaE